MQVCCGHAWNVEVDTVIHDQESYVPFLQMDVKRGVSAVVEPSHAAAPGARGSLGFRGSGSGTRTCTRSSSGSSSSSSSSSSIVVVVVVLVLVLVVVVVVVVEVVGEVVVVVVVVHRARWLL